MYKTKKFGLITCKTENRILEDLEKDLSRKRRNKHEFAVRNKGKKSDNR